MKFMVFVCVDRATDEQAPPTGPEPTGGMAWSDDLDARGIRLDGGELGPVRDARTVRIRGGEVVVADGPFAETKEVIAGYDILDCASLEEAVAVAARHPVARSGVLEIRPLRP